MEIRMEVEMLEALSYEAFLEGYSAYDKGKKQSDNPYQVPFSSAWDAGWQSREEEVLNDKKRD